jgi:hypothetical protein
MTFATCGRRFDRDHFLWEMEADMTIRSCIYAESHLTAVLEMMKDRPELHPIIPLLEKALAEVGAIKRTQSLLFRARTASESRSGID